MKIIHKYNLFLNFDFMYFHANKRQYFDKLHTQKNKAIRPRIHKNDLDIILRSVHVSVKLQIAKKKQLTVFCSTFETTSFG